MFDVRPSGTGGGRGLRVRGQGPVRAAVGRDARLEGDASVAELLRAPRDSARPRARTRRNASLDF